MIVCNDVNVLHHMIRRATEWDDVEEYIPKHGTLEIVD